MNGPAPAPVRGGPGSRGWRIGLLFAAVWLLFLVGPLIDLWSRGNPLGAELLGTALTGGFVVLYLWRVAQPFRPEHAGMVWWPPLAALAVALLMLPLAGVSALSFLVFVAVMCQTLWPIRWAIAGSAAVAVGCLVLGAVVPGWWDTAVSIAFSSLAASMAMFGVARMAERNRALTLAQEERAELAVVHERERFATDLHDILGHSLTVITVKAQLAGRLVDRDPEAARAEIADVERLAREALQDVRSTVGGYRTVTLVGELAAARTALAAAGIDADLPGAVDEISGEQRELFGRVVREAVTNVVRHSGATRCRITLDPDGVRIEDDGKGGAAVDGAGLRGLRARVREAGGELSAGPAPQGGFAVQVRFAPRVESPGPTRPALRRAPATS